ncbi:hypothetical protein ARMSODRAFT_1017634 [Armillaria solidipes]|uniref:Uncharacterized protein n=1 Tax=Armillaria solidipes TaxID=1076256 RepID=A0A2H3C6C4_9AGAR|nr:hypothetical protein ARMSODRAFT_1017634 [Armillaria solidipes]
MALECELAAPSIDNQLWPRTGRRYIVVGGGSRVDGSSCSCSDAPWLQSANHYKYDFPFTFQSPPVLLAGDYSAAPRRMSVLSFEQSSLDPVAELAQCVRESAGAVMAMLTMGSVSSASLSSSSSVSSTASTPPHSTPPASQAVPFCATIVPFSVTAPNAILISSRRQTSHTTIERRNCTNLNTRMQSRSLRMAVSALRVSELNDGPKKSKGQRPRSEMKKTRQISLMSKDTLMKEVGQSQRPWNDCRDGLNALVSGLVDESSHLPTLETEWREKFGGEENNEVDTLDIDLPESDDGNNNEEEGRCPRSRCRLHRPLPLYPLVHLLY